MALLTKVGYGQVEPNHLSAQRTGQIHAQKVWEVTTDTELENGSFLKYDGTIDGTGEWFLVYNEVKLYDKARQSYKDFALKVSEGLGGEIVPRLFKLNEGDIFTTNLVDHTTAHGASLVGKKFVPTVGVDSAILTEKTTPADGEMVFEVLAATTMPDAQKAVKVRYIGKAVVHPEA